jgi:hypothetical protein
LEPTIAVFEWVKTFLALVLAAVHCDRPYFCMAHKYYHCCFISIGYSTTLSASKVYSVGVITVIFIIINIIIITEKYLIYQILSVFKNRLFSGLPGLFITWAVSLYLRSLMKQ